LNNNNGPPTNRAWTDRTANYDRNGPGNRRYDNFTQPTTNPPSTWQGSGRPDNAMYDRRPANFTDRRDTRGYTNNRDGPQPTNTWTQPAPNTGAFNQPPARTGYNDSMMGSGRTDPYMGNRDQPYQAAKNVMDYPQARYEEQGRFPTDNAKYTTGYDSNNQPGYQANYTQRHAEYSGNTSRDYVEHMKPPSQPVMQLPTDWQEFATEDNKKYYYNTRTKTSQWEFPTAAGTDSRKL
jgi:hypothetical protein